MLHLITIVLGPLLNFDFLLFRHLYEFLIVDLLHLALLGLQKVEIALKFLLFSFYPGLYLNDLCLFLVQLGLNLLFSYILLISNVCL